MTALEFIIEEISRKDWWHLPKSMKLEIIEQAKEMEKQQIMKAVFESMGTNLDPNMGRAEQYYNETYK